MTTQDNPTDGRTDSQKIEMATWFAEERGEIERADKLEIVHEDSEAVVVADHHGHELNEWASQLGGDREELRATMRSLAEQKLGEQEAHEIFSYADPVVFDKLED